MYTTKDKLFYEDKSNRYNFVSTDDICNKLLSLNIELNSEIVWFYCEYTKGYTLWSPIEAVRIWSVIEIEEENISGGKEIKPNEFYFSDILIWCNSLFFKYTDQHTAEVWIDWNHNKYLLSPSIKEWIATLNLSWEDGLYNWKLKDL